MRIGLGQMNVIVGDLKGNLEKIHDFGTQAKRAGCDLLVTPELAVTGYPPQDLLFKRHFISEQMELVNTLLPGQLELPALVGFVDRDGETGKLYNSVAYIDGGKLRRVIHKTLLPTYDVFDEWRYFRPARDNSPIEINGRTAAVTICEDIWDEHYDRKVVDELVAEGAEFLINLSSSPFHAGKRRVRLELCRRHAMKHQIPVLYCNLVGAQDELVFDGESLAMDGRGRLIALGPQFTEKLVIADCCPIRGAAPAVIIPDFHFEREVFSALKLGVADYFAKCGFNSAVIGLSGGIDSALVAVIAKEALGAGNVVCVAMPSRFTAEMSNTDAALLAANLGVEFHVLPIEASVQLARQRYEEEFGSYARSVTLENVQARERGKILMEISNDTNALVLATGNKTEYALGYSTLYGDMCGGLAVIGDVSKPEVYALARYYNTWRGAEVIPRRIIERAPSAELREGQVDPFDYNRISPLADAVIEEHLSREEILALPQQYTEAEVDQVFRLVRINEYKRRQAAPIIRVTEKAFGIGRKMPIVNKYQW
ncbi:NAD+ synthase [bacterium]|nr:NAD+ synthase [bacterium]